MHELLKTGFKKNEVLVCSIFIASALWITNAVFNYNAADYRALSINLLYVVCLIPLGLASFKKENNVVQGLMGALLMISIVGNVNVLSEMLTEDIPSRNLWQLKIGLVVTAAIFINHFMIALPKYRNKKRIILNQILIMALLLFRCYQIIINLVSGGITPLMIEVNIGMLAIIPTLNVIACIECRGDGYKIQ